MKEVIIVFGVIECLMVFLENDWFGILLVDVGCIYLNCYGVKVGYKVLVVIVCDMVW